MPGVSFAFLFDPIHHEVAAFPPSRDELVHPCGEPFEAVGLQCLDHALHEVALHAAVKCRVAVLMGAPQDIGLAPVQLSDSHQRLLTPSLLDHLMVSPSVYCGSRMG